jgi:hypothetical protein
VISISLDRWRITWFALIVEVLCLLGYDAVYCDSYDTRSARRLVLFSQTANMVNGIWYLSAKHPAVMIRKSAKEINLKLQFFIFSRDLVCFNH